MEKVKLEFRPIKEVVIDAGESQIKVKPYISPENELILISSYVDAYFNASKSKPTIGGSDFDFIGAEYTLLVGIFDLLTNVQVFNEDGSICLDFSAIAACDILSKIKRQVVNYPEFEMRLYRVVGDIKEQIYNSKAVGAVLDGVAQKIGAVLESISKLDVSPEGVEKMKASLDELAKKVEDSPLKSLMDESKKPVRKRKAKAE